MDCIVCKKHLENVWRESGANQPMDGSEFVTYGQYGSAVTDTMDGIAHCVNVCDECLKVALAEGRAYKCDLNRERV